MWKALEELGIEKSTFFVAQKRHDYLKNAIVREKHPDTGAEWVQISKAAVDKYAAERRAGGSSGSHPGQMKRTVWLSDEETLVAEQVLSAKFGRDISIDRLYRAKAAAEGETEDAAE
jgi:hypothetical protein